MKCGSLFSGVGGLDLAVCEFFRADLAWVCEIEPGPVKVLERHFPGVPNLGDITKVDWNEVEPVDIICGGFPCQDISYAGLGAGIRPDTRSGLWAHFAAAIRHLRPEYAVVENVSALLARGMGIVLGDLAEAGFDAEWTSFRASDVGAPHRRERIFILATNRSEVDAQGRRGERQQRSVLGEVSPGGDRNDSAPDPASEGLQGQTGGRVQLREPSSFDWGSFEPAIRRWERVMGPVPSPIDSKNRLEPLFVEWMMGFPTGYVDGLSRSQSLKALGNAVVPQQAFAALLKLTMESVLSKVSA